MSDDRSRLRLELTPDEARALRAILREAARSEQWADRRGDISGLIARLEAMEPGHAPAF